MYSIDLSNRVAVVTGGASGIGRAIALALVKAGAHVTLIDTNRAGMFETASLAAGIGSNVTIHECNVSMGAQVEAAVRDIVTDHGSIDILVNAAGIWADGSMSDVDNLGLREVINVNLMGPMLMSRAVWPHMAGGGVIINISSVQAHGVYVTPGPYGITKAGVEALTRTQAAEGGPLGIRANCVVPGAIARTGMSDWSQVTQTFMNTWHTAIPAGRRGRPEEVAHAVLMLCAPEASYMSGAIVLVDGGLSCEHRPVTLLPKPATHPEDPDAPGR